MDLNGHCILDRRNVRQIEHGTRDVLSRLQNNLPDLIRLRQFQMQKRFPPGGEALIPGQDGRNEGDEKPLSSGVLILKCNTFGTLRGSKPAR